MKSNLESIETDPPAQESQTGLSRRQAIGRMGGIVLASSLAKQALAQEEPDLEDSPDSNNTSNDAFRSFLERLKTKNTNGRTSGLARSRHTATRIPGWGVLVAGGDNNGALSGAEFYEPNRGIWHDAASMNLPRADHAAVLLQDGRVLVTGGYFRSALSGTEIYDPFRDRWTEVASMNLPRFQHTLVRLSGHRVLVMGGNFDGPLSSVEEYNVRKNTWTTL